ncbi:hypothetical protein BO94DRAFT_573908 [Aspergillus sclerotioniger CBS 115572]|uniref:Uncharacterized protein n=1 Tax=Aspergillus sclerotioniger CBS 115572 TaxID=1450535 RepID=A0A317X1K7_9EURO|nr:hypothetical protein BO94DRAFT_573908 [Aspergillus sclerotioniger CBS 115572]PWY91482.1 hypothetical protein BO94DRAFT_573908 [Aspergillus sclerotioniger CBS 115572]
MPNKGPRSRRASFKERVEFDPPPDAKPEYLTDDLEELQAAQRKAKEVEDRNVELAKLNDELAQKLHISKQSLEEQHKATVNADAARILAEKLSDAREKTIKAAEEVNEQLQKKTEVQKGRINQLQEQNKKIARDKDEIDRIIKSQQDKLNDNEEEMKKLKHQLTTQQWEITSMRTEYQARMTEADRNKLFLLERVHRAIETEDIAEHAMLETVQHPGVTWPELAPSSDSGQMIPSGANQTLLSLSEELQNTLYSLSEGTASRSSLATLYGQQAQLDRETDPASLPDAPSLFGQSLAPAAEVAPMDWGNVEQAAHAGVIPFLGDLSNTNRKRPLSELENADGFHEVDNAFARGKKIRIAAGQSQLEQIQGNVGYDNRFEFPLFNPATSRKLWGRTYRTAGVQTLDNSLKPQPTATIISVKQPSEPERKLKRSLSCGPNYSGPVYLPKKYESHPLEIKPSRTTPKAWTNLSTDQLPATGALQTHIVPRKRIANRVTQTAPKKVHEEPPIPIWMMVLVALFSLGVLLVVWALLGRLIRWLFITLKWMHYNEVPEDVLRMVRGRKRPGWLWVRKIDYNLARLVDIKSGLLG